MLFEWAILPLFAAVAYVAPVIMERELYLREVADGLYGPATYLVFKLFSALALATLLTLPVSAAVFFATGLQGSFAFFWLTYVAQVWLAVAMAYATATALPAIDTACLVLTTYSALSYLTFFNNLTSDRSVTTCLWLGDFVIVFDVIPGACVFMAWAWLIRYCRLLALGDICESHPVHLVCTDAQPFSRCPR